MLDGKDKKATGSARVISDVSHLGQQNHQATGRQRTQGRLPHLEHRFAMSFVWIHTLFFLAASKYLSSR